METLAWWGLGLGVVVIVGMLVAAIIIQRINMTGLQAIIASQAETIDAVRAERDDTVARHKEAAGRASDVLMQNADKALAERNEAIARRKEAADRANVLEGKVRLLESELTGTVRRCDVEMARLREAWEARIAELELERDRERFERDQAWQQHDRAAAEWDKQKAIADALADQNKQLADAHDAMAAERQRANEEAKAVQG